MTDRDLDYIQAPIRPSGGLLPPGRGTKSRAHAPEGERPRSVVAGMSPEASSVDEAAVRAGSAFRAVLGHFASSVLVVAGVSAGEPAGFSCQSFFSLSLDPPLVAIAVGRSSASWPAIEASGAFCANVLSQDQEALCQAFARSGHDKFAGVAWRPAMTGSPCLDEALAWVDCRIEAVHQAGDHYLVIGSVVDLAARKGSPLLYYRGHFAAMEPIESRSGQDRSDRRDESCLKKTDET